VWSGREISNSALDASERLQRSGCYKAAAAAAAARRQKVIHCSAQSATTVGKRCAWCGYISQPSLSRSGVYHSRRSHKPRLILTFLWSLITWINRSAARVECIVLRWSARGAVTRLHGRPASIKMTKSCSGIYMCVCAAPSDKCELCTCMQEPFIAPSVPNFHSRASLHVAEFSIKPCEFWVKHRMHEAGRAIIGGNEFKQMWSVIT
jgi:hypothetical protein